MSVKLAKVKSDQVPICSVTLSVSYQEREECLGKIGIGWDWDWMGLGLDGNAWMGLTAGTSTASQVDLN